MTITLLSMAPVIPVLVASHMLLNLRDVLTITTMDLDASTHYNYDRGGPSRRDTRGGGVRFATTTTVTTDFETIELTKRARLDPTLVDAAGNEVTASRRIPPANQPTFLNISTRSDYKEFGTPPAIDPAFYSAEDMWGSHRSPTSDSPAQLSSQTLQSRSRPRLSFHGQSLPSIAEPLAGAPGLEATAEGAEVQSSASTRRPSFGETLASDAYPESGRSSPLGHAPGVLDITGPR